MNLWKINQAIERSIESALSVKPTHFLLIAIVLSALLIIFTNQVVLQDFPNSGDEYSYLISANLFAQGKLAESSPPNKEFFDFFHVINDGKFYSKYPPGWPFLLSIGVIAGSTMLVNLAIAILSILVIYFICNEFFSGKVAKIAVLLTIISPYFLFNSASYFSHSASLLLFAICTYFYFKAQKSQKLIYWALIGLGVGAILNIRPLDAALFAIALIIHSALQLRAQKELIKEIIQLAKKFAVFAVGVAILLAVFLAYNFAQTQDPFLMPFSKYNPYDTLGFSENFSLQNAIENNLMQRSWMLNIWTPFCYLLILLAILRVKNSNSSFLLLLLSALLAGYFFYFSPGGNQYGPRYLYSAAFVIFILGAQAIAALKKNAGILLIGLLLANIVVFSFMANIFHTQIEERTELYDLIESQKISNSIVFLNCPFFCSGTIPALDLTRNGTTFDQSAIYVHDRGAENVKIMDQYQAREYYRWSCNPKIIGYIWILDIGFAKNE